MNIGIFTDAYYPQINGVVTSTRILENELRKMGHNVYIFTGKDPRVVQKEENVIRMPSLPFIFLPTFRVSSVFSFKAFRQVQKYNLNIVHTQTEFSLGLFGKAVSKILKIPLVHTYHTMYEEYVHYIARGHLITPQMARDFSKIFCNSSLAVIAPTKKVEKLLLNYGVKKSIYIVPTGLNLEPFRRGNYEDELPKLRKEYNIAETDKVIVSVGRVAKEKSLDVIINNMPKLIEKLPNVKFMIVGNGPLIKELTEMAERLNVGANVIFTGEKPWNTIGMYYQLGDAFVSASVSETQGLVFIEAMAASVAVVAKKDESTTHLITDKENGRLFDNNEELYQVLYEVLSDEKHRHHLIQNALKTANPYSADLFAKSIERVYIKVITENNAKYGTSKPNTTNKRKRNVLKRRNYQNE